MMFRASLVLKRVKKADETKLVARSFEECRTSSRSSTRVFAEDLFLRFVTDSQATRDSVHLIAFLDCTNLDDLGRCCCFRINVRR